MVAPFGRSAIGSYPIAGKLARAKPTVNVTSPAGVITTATLAFTYSSTVGQPQVSYQYQVRTADGSVVLDDSGTVVSAATSGIAIDFAFAPGSSYQLWVRASDWMDTSAWDTIDFSMEEGFDVLDYPDETRVGSVYEIGINGRGYMLSDNPERPVRRRSQVLDAPRLATGDTPFTEAIERYTFVGFSSFKGGAGQTYLDRPDSDPEKFFDSEGVNPFQGDALQLLPSTTLQIADGYGTPYMVVASGLLFVATADGELTSRSTPAGSNTTFTITGATEVADMASDGTNWYFADGANIFQGSTAADPVTAWSTIDAQKLCWAVDRLAAVYEDGANLLCVTTLDATGAEEVAGGRFKYPDTVDIADLAAGDGYMWFIVNRTDSSQIHFWQIGSADTYAASGLTLPAGQKATALGFYLGNLFVRAVENLDGGGTRAIIYRCVPNEGVLTPERVLDWEDDFDNSWGSFAGDDRFVLFSWKEMTSADVSGLGAIDLSTGGYAKWISGGTGVVRSVALWNGLLAYTVDGVGTYVEDTTPVSSGFLRTSLSDQASALIKVYDEVRASFDPLPSGGTVSLEITTDGATSYDALTTDGDTAGQASIVETIGTEARSVGLKINLGATSSTPKVRNAQVKLHPRSITDQLVTFPINCSDQLSGLNGQSLSVSSPGSGMKRARFLESLMGSRIKLQDVDWPVSGVSTVWEVIDIDLTTVGTFDRSLNRRVDSAVALLTLRRAL
jgi:hypothetical protein